ncbi:MAG: ATP-binding protein [Rhodothermaceae bacterium]|nr:ATP-binding protein [Rhodothermaceae bacterium]
MPLADSASRKRIGVLTHGSLGQGVEMKLDPSRSVESVRAGTFVVVEGAQFDFFSLITDLTIEAANENILLNPPGRDEELLRRVMQGSGTYATVSLKPMLMVEQDQLEDKAEVRPVKTVPAHFSSVGEATEADVARVFGSEQQDGGDRFFHVGEPLGMDTPVCLDLARFVERSNAVFGKTGTGKSFLTRLLLCGTIKTSRAVNLIFDMHNEYGFKARRESDGQAQLFVPGLKQLFGAKVQIFSLDPASTRRRGGSPDVEVHLYADQVEPEDILPLRETLNLTATATESTYQLKKKYGPRWLSTLLQAETAEIEGIAEETGAHPGSLLALRRKLDRLDGLPFFHLDAPTSGRRDLIDELLEAIEAGRSVVLEFGQYNSLLVYLFVANVITRRLRDRYESKYETYERTQDEADKPQQLLITIEEAHKFLGPETARETPFGKIAREMRKFSVSLLIVDQRPSGIDEEVLSQIGTKIVAQLNDEKDIAAALVGTPGSAGLRQILASLDSKQQALALGHAVPMPITLRTRTYDETFFDAMTEGRSIASNTATMQSDMQALFS